MLTIRTIPVSGQPHGTGGERCALFHDPEHPELPLKEYCCPEGQVWGWHLPGTNGMWHCETLAEHKLLNGK